MPKSVIVPKPFEALFDVAENYVEKLFTEFKRDSENGQIYIGQERYILVRAESMFSALFDQLEQSFGIEQASEFIYNMARIIGKADSKAFSETRNLTDPNEKLSTGPVMFAHTGWATVDIYPDSRPSPDENFFLHYQHPNTFESEIYLKREKKTDSPICYFSAGYSAGWCSEAYGLEVHAREIKCTARGDARCEFVMALFDKLDKYADNYK